MKNNKGFTLIELLAVIVVLAIIALIATPIVINIIGSTKESADDRSAELYLHAVEQAVASKNLSEKFSPNTCEIQSDGNLKCDGDTLLEVQVENTRPTSGTITFERGKISDYTFEINSKEYTNIPKVESTAESCFTTQDIDGGVSITGYNCGSGTENEILDVVIPGTIGSKKVITIGNGAFIGKGLKSVVIPKQVTTISDNAFYVNSLTSATIPSSVTSIGNGAFGFNKLTNVTIPPGITSIETLTFAGNELTSILIPPSVTSIGSSAFTGNKLTSVIIPKSVTIIDASAFSSNQLTSVTIKGKTSTSDFASFSSDAFGWASGYSDSNIVFEP